MGYKSPLQDCHPDSTSYREIGDASVPWTYTDLESEYQALRSEAGLFDHGCVGLVAVTGDGHRAFLQDVLARDIEFLSAEHCMTSLMLDEDATPVDVVTVYALDDGVLLESSVGAADRLTKHLRNVAPADVELKKLEDRTLIAVEGPYSWGVVGQVIDQEFTALPFETVVETSWNDQPVMFARSGHTSEYGYKFLADIEVAAELWKALCAEAVPVGQAVLESAMLEVRQPVLYREVQGDDLLACGYNWLVDINKEAFRGRAALDRLVEAGPTKRTLGLQSDTELPPGSLVLAGDQDVGHVVLTTYSHGLGAHLSFARVEWALAASGLDFTVSHDGGQAIARSLSSPYVVPASWSVPLF